MGSDRRRALICDDDESTSHALGAILPRCGFEVVATVESFGAALVEAALARPDVVVVELATAGDLGVHVVDAIEAALPGCAIVVLSPFEALRASLLEAGAYDVVSNAERDLRDLQRCLVRLSQELHRSEPGPVAQVGGPPAAQD
ncbi:MAG: response regulator [Acidimicrobiales bacterium]